MRPFACPFCSYADLNPSILVNHINSYHVEFPDEPAAAASSGIAPSRSTSSFANCPHQQNSAARRSLSTSASEFNPPRSARSPTLSRHHSVVGNGNHNRSYCSWYRSSTANGAFRQDLRQRQPESHATECAVTQDAEKQQPQQQQQEQYHRQESQEEPEQKHEQESAGDASRGRGWSSSCRPRSRSRKSTSGDIATPGLIFKGFFNACLSSIGYNGSKNDASRRKDPPKSSAQLSQQQQQTNDSATSQVIVGTPPRRSSDLGPYAHEKRMPKALYRALKSEPRITYITRTRANGRRERIRVIVNETPNIIPLLERLSALDTDIVAQAVYCAPHIRHVFKMDEEGGFCGYRNIQMLISHVQGSGSKGQAQFPKKHLPSIIDLQEMIEEAWDRGYNTIGRTDTGGIRRTRKYIGTSEAQALFQSQGFNCEPEAFFTNNERTAYEALISRVWEYFLSPGAQVTESNVITTNMAPIYLQHQGHSMTIVGIEKHIDGSDHLIVLDPGTKASPDIRALVGRKIVQCGRAGEYLQAYRRNVDYLSMYNAFEILRLDA